MKQVVQSARTGKLEVKQVPAPQVSPGHLLVRTRASLISAGTERISLRQGMVEARAAGSDEEGDRGALRFRLPTGRARRDCRPLD